MNHETVAVLATLGCHPERVEDEQRRLGAVDRPADNEPRERVEDDAAVDLAVARRVLGDVGHPQLVRPVTTERATVAAKRKSACGLFRIIREARTALRRGGGRTRRYFHENSR